MDYIIDIGSRSLKLYRMPREGSDALQVLQVVNWDPIVTQPTVHVVRSHLRELLTSVQDGGAVSAIGTAAMRRFEGLALATSEACGELGIHYSTIGQVEEAELIRLACHDMAHGLDIVNAGGGSIQIVKRDNALCLLPFGMTDLNQKFCLNGPPSDRSIATCVDWIALQLPDDVGPFMYTGGERSYLSKLGVALSDDGVCRKADFVHCAKQVAALDEMELETRSPFGPGWMHGAVASNCIVEAYLAKSNTHQFVASDVNIAHGLLRNYRPNKPR